MPPVFLLAISPETLMGCRYLKNIGVTPWSCFASCVAICKFELQFANMQPLFRNRLPVNIYFIVRRKLSILHMKKVCGSKTTLTQMRYVFIGAIIAGNSHFCLIWSAGIPAGKYYSVSISLFTFHYLSRQGCRRSRWAAKMRIANALRQ